MSKTQSITLSDGKEVSISLLPLRAYGDLLVSLQSVFKEAIGKFDSLGTDDLIEQLPAFIQDHMAEAGAIIEIGTRGQVTATEALDERGLADAITVVAAVIDVNDVEGMVAQIKKARAVFRKTKATAQPPQSPVPQSTTTPVQQ